MSYWNKRLKQFKFELVLMFICPIRKNERKRSQFQLNVQTFINRTFLIRTNERNRSNSNLIKCVSIEHVLFEQTNKAVTVRTRLNV
jgi:hypothetical protein